MNKKIDFLGIGTPKCATTWIHKCLKEHPEVCVGSERDMHFFNKYHGVRNKDKKWKYKKEGIEDYWKYFRHCKSNQKIGEFSAWYLYDKNTPKLIKKHLGINTKFIVSLRNPIKRSYSHYKHILSKKEKEISLKEAIKENRDILECSRYHKYLQKYFYIFPRENFLILIFEKIQKKGPVKFIQKIYDFLGVDSSFEPHYAKIKVNESKKRLSSSATKVNKYIGKIYRNLKYYNIIPEKVGSLAKEKGYNVKIKSLIKNIFGKNNKKTLSAEQKEYLYNLLKKDIEKTEELLNNNFWNNS